MVRIVGTSTVPPGARNGRGRVSARSNGFGPGRPQPQRVHDHRAGVAADRAAVEQVGDQPAGAALDVGVDLLPGRLGRAAEVGAAGGAAGPGLDQVPVRRGQRQGQVGPQRVGHGQGGLRALPAAGGGRRAEARAGGERGGQRVQVAVRGEQRGQLVPGAPRAPAAVSPRAAATEYGDQAKLGRRPAATRACRPSAKRRSGAVTRPTLPAPATCRRRQLCGRLVRLRCMG